MERDSFIFYRSFYEAIMCINNEDKIEVYEAICNYSLNGIETEFNSKTAKAIFTLIKPNIDNATNRYKASVENGKKGGRPRKNKNLEKPNNNLDITQEKANQNLNVYEDVYVDEYVYEDIKEEEINKEEEKSILEIASEEFIRITPIQYEMLNEFESEYGKDILLLAIKECVKQEVRNFSYLEAILNNWKGKTLEEIKTFMKKNKKKNETIPSCLKEPEKEEEWVMTDEIRKKYNID